MDQTANQNNSSFRLYLLEFSGLFAILWFYGAWPVPDVNEAYYLGKAIHFWNPSWCSGDAFLDSKDAHWFFFATFGWFSLFLNPTLFAWSGRIIIWALFAWSWRRLSWAFVPCPFFSLLSVAGLLHYLDVFQMSGEWIIGGVEGKGFAFPFFLLGLEALIRQQWKRVWPLFGASAAFHVLIGGWSVLIALFIWFLQAPKNRTAFVPMLPFLLLGGLLSLPGLIPALLLDYGTPHETISQAHWVYVYERLAHHLVPSAFPWTFRLRFGVLILLWSTLSLFYFYCFRPFQNRLKDLNKSNDSNGLNRLNGLKLESDSDDFPERRTRFSLLNQFVIGTLILAGIGFAIDWMFSNRPFLAADLLRFYWFRMSDIAVPLAFSLFATTLLYLTLFESQPAQERLKREKVKFQPKHEVLQPAKEESQLAKAESQSGNDCPYLTSVQDTESSKRLIKSFALIFGAGFAVFLFLDWLIFGLLFFTWFPPPDPSIPWGLTLIAGFVVLFVLLRGQETLKKSGPKGSSIPFLLLLSLLLTIVIWGPSQQVVQLAESRTRFAYPRNEGSSRNAFLWEDVCNWMNDPTNGIPQNARFLTPRETTSFKWKTNRPEVANWKEIPQDAAGIVNWYNTVEELFTFRPDNEPVRRDFPLSSMLERYNPEQFQELREKYQFDFVLCNKYPALKLPVLYENLGFVLYDARNTKKQETVEKPHLLDSPE
ncbi:MAG: DUF6798 domain-containing protein [Thermoguttaceae bacterium]